MLTITKPKIVNDDRNYYTPNDLPVLDERPGLSTKFNHLITKELLERLRKEAYEGLRLT